MTPQFHIVIPFYYGRSTAAGKKFGAPFKKKLNYLKATINSLYTTLGTPQVYLFVCNETSKKIASTIHDKVFCIDSPSHCLPLFSLISFKERFAPQISNDDFFLFNEDDQVLHADKTVLRDIVFCKERYIFSPHRWSRLFHFFRIKKRPVYRLNGVRGVIDNYRSLNKKEHCTVKLNRLWEIQENKLEAYAACWTSRISVFKTIPLIVPVEKRCLEQASYVAFDSGIPVLKPRIVPGQSFGDFAVDHLSGYDYNRRILFKWMYG